MASNTKQDDMDRWKFPPENASREELAALWDDLVKNGPVHGTPDKKLNDAPFLVGRSTKGNPRNDLKLKISVKPDTQDIPELDLDLVEEELARLRASKQK